VVRPIGPDAGLMARVVGIRKADWKEHAMPTFMFFDVLEITDAALMDDYRSKVLATVQQFGGVYRTVGGAVTPLEGSWRPAFPVLIEFPTAKHARDWYDSDAYRPLREKRLAATRGHCVMIEGAPFHPG
jgi:uncharacterized protein (DUF1330 family)